MQEWARSEVLEALGRKVPAGVVQDLPLDQRGAEGGEMMNCARCKVVQSSMLAVCEAVLVEDQRGGFYQSYEPLGRICWKCWDEIKAFVSSAVSAPVMSPGQSTRELKPTPAPRIRKSRATGRKPR